MELVLAVRHSLSAPIWLKPSTILPGSPASCFEQAASAEAHAAASSRQCSLLVSFMRSPGYLLFDHCGAGRTSQRDARRSARNRAAPRASGLTSGAPSAGRSISNVSPGSALDTVDEAQRGGAEEVQVHVARACGARVLEVVVFEVGEGVAHVVLAGAGRVSPRAPCRRGGCGSRLPGARGSAPVRSSGPTPHCRSFECARYR